MRTKWEWFRLITPILVSIGLWYAQDIRANVIKVENRLTSLEDRVTVNDVKSTERIVRVEAILEFIKERRFKWQD